ncbi:caffeoylshikimate esterase-like, partial [Vigna angularis]|uniref:caffeoylshikimate esterase-like n=1 Tax=Phaseolus angularis TaxID=3914 RepID=UPI0022B48264
NTHYDDAGRVLPHRHQARRSSLYSHRCRQRLLLLPLPQEQPSPIPLPYRRNFRQRELGLKYTQCPGALFVPSVNLVADDCLSFFNSIKQQNPQFQHLPSFLFGESMGAAICLLIHFLSPEPFNGAVLVAPMCKISDSVRPRWPIPQILTFLARFFPTLPIVPTPDLLFKSVKVPRKKLIANMNPLRYRGKPRLGTVVELLRVTDFLNQRLSDVNLPFIVLHGSADAVTDPDVSRELYREARTLDKTIKVYDGMMHSLLFGETDENVEIVRNDVLSWLLARSGGETRLQ